MAGGAARGRRPQKLTKLVLGSNQERALRKVAEAAVDLTAVELAPASGEQAEQLAMVVGEVFRDPAPEVALAGPAALLEVLLEVLQAGIAAKMAVLDDLDMTGTGQSSAQVLGSTGRGCWRRRWPLAWYRRL